MSRKLLVPSLLVSVAVLGAAATVFRSQSLAQPAAPPSPSKYTVIETDGTNLLVVDNSSNTLFFYTVDEGKAVGDDLQLRGSLDLNQVGKPTLSPKKAAK